MTPKMLIPSIVASLLASTLIVGANSLAEAVHLPLLLTFAIALALGFWQYQKGWIAALFLTAGIIVGYFAIQVLAVSVQHPSTFSFLSFISPLPCLFGSFMGSYFRKIIQ